ncbi:MAG: hypothetical protein HYY24_21860 [Verrucomicrobia bacterium]|nr:hypothetical protein [Verrucomicrobiota bacterium]
MPRSAIHDARPASQRLLTALLVGSLLLLAVFSAGPLLHQLLHADAQAAGHECVINAFSDGKVTYADNTPPVAERGLSLNDGPTRPLLPPRAPIEHRQAASRAPPPAAAVCVVV